MTASYKTFAMAQSDTSAKASSLIHISLLEIGAWVNDAVTESKRETPNRTHAGRIYTKNGKVSRARPTCSARYRNTHSMEHFLNNVADRPIQEKLYEEAIVWKGS